MLAQGRSASRRWKHILRHSMWSWIADWQTRTAKREQTTCNVTTFQAANIKAKTASCLCLMQSAVSYEHSFPSEQTPSLHLKIDSASA